MTESATTPDSSEWILSTGEWDPETVTHNGNRFLLGNGAMGYRGTLEEFGPEEKVGILVSGLFDRVGDAWREPVNAPNPLFLRISADGTLLNPLSTAPDSHEQALNLLQAIHQRRTSFSVGQLQVAFTTERFLSAATTQLLALRCRIEIEGEGELVIESGIDDRIWDLNGPHLEDFRRTEEAGLSLLTARTHEAGKELAVAERARLVEDTTEIKGEIVDGLHCWTLPVSGSRTLVLEKIAAVCTPLDFPDSDVADNALQIVTQASDLGYDALCKLHADVWEARWQRADVRLEGDPEGQLALRYSLYQLISAAPFHSADLSIPARALSGQVYKGAVFWDTELFMLPFFLSTFPEVAHNLVAYRIRTLSGAKEKAREYGFKGAFYAWEGQEGGYDACTLFNVTDVFTQRPMRTYFRDKQIHISADVAWALWQTVSVTGDLDLLWDGGFEVLLECVRFLYSYAYRRSDNSEFVLCDVTGPDEYHERVNNNAYTNYMTQSAAAGLFAALECLRTAEEGRLEKLLMELGATPSELTALRDFRDRLYLPQPNEATRLIEQFDGYFALEDCSLAELKSRILEPTEYLGGGNGLATTTRILKQADVVLLLHLFADRFTEKEKALNWDFYEPRTEHGSSLSACAYALVATATGRLEFAYRYFLKTARIDLDGGGKQYVGPLYIGGTHPAANGGAWMVAVQGFGGLRHYADHLSLAPRLPESWTEISFKTTWRGCTVSFHITPDLVNAKAAPENPLTVPLQIGTERLSLAPGAGILRKP